MPKALLSKLEVEDTLLQFVLIRIPLLLLLVIFLFVLTSFQVIHDTFQTCRFNCCLDDLSLTHFFSSSFESLRVL